MAVSSPQRIVFACAALSLALAFATPSASAGGGADSAAPLVLGGRGSFFIGGETVAQDFVELGSLRPADTVTVNQMYVDYMLPPDGRRKTPVVMVHGAGLSGSCYDTTPDGRMGWYEYFVRNAHPVYVVDQIGRGRSGFNQAIFNNVRAGREDPSKLPRITRMGDLHASWINFRFGPEKGVSYPDSQFPVEAAAHLSQMGIPDLDAALPSPNPNAGALAQLAEKAGGAILLGHSQSGHYPIQSALLRPDAVSGMILIEPGTCLQDTLTSAQIETLAGIPLLVVYGDHLSASTELPGNVPGWQQRFDGCKALIGRIRQAGGRADMLYPPERGIHGNSHMIMQDRNNLQIAGLIMEWIATNIAEKTKTQP